MFQIVVVLLLLLGLLCPGSSVSNLALLDSFIKEEEALVNWIVSKAEEAHGNREDHVRNCTCSLHACAAEPNIPFECSPFLGTPQSCGSSCGSMLNYNSSSVRLPPGIDPDRLSSSMKESLCTYKALDKEFKALQPNIRTWIYAGTVDGTHRMHPVQMVDLGLEDGDASVNNCSKYDPRSRPWYVAASTGPKDVVILLEASKLTHAHNRGWRLMMQKIEILMGTFTFSDYVNIVVVGADARPLWRASPLLRGSIRNLAALRTELEGVERKGVADSNKGFEFAFQLLEGASRGTTSSSGCSRVIIFLTQGLDCSKFKNVTCSLPSTGGTEILLQNIDVMQEKLEEAVGSKATIFTFSVGRHAHDSLPRQIACRNDGLWSSLMEQDEAITKLQSYTKFLAAGYKVRDPVWTNPYEDAFGLGMMTTVAKPFYSSGGPNGTESVLLGVVGHDILLKELEVGGLSNEAVVQDLIKESRRCAEVQLQGCQKQIQRQYSTMDSTCPDVFPQHNCYKYGAHWYAAYTDNRSWEAAKIQCITRSGRLTPVRSLQHLSFIASLASPSGSWLGGRRLQKQKKNEHNWEDSDVKALDSKSVYWARGSPGTRKGDRCTMIDPRGALRNIESVNCTQAAQYICEFEKKPLGCLGDILDVSTKPYFKEPPLSSCTQSSKFDHPTESTPLAESLASFTALCDLGIDKPAPKGRICCSECESDEDSQSAVEYSPFPEDLCDLERATRVCPDNVLVRNLLVRLCSFDIGGPICCTFLRSKRESLTWAFFRDCACHSDTACDVSPYMDLPKVFEACGIILNGIPAC